MSELDEQITLCRNELQLHPEGHPNRVNELARLLYDRFDRRGEIADINEAIALMRATLEFRPQGHPQPLSIYLKQFVRPSDLEEASILGLNALELYSQWNPDRAHSLGNLASSLCSCFKQLGRLPDLEEAIALERRALELRLQGHPDRAYSLSNLASSLRSRFNQLGRLPDLEEAITLERSALEQVRPQGHPDRASSLGTLASYLHARFEHSPVHDISDFQETFNVYCQLSDIPRIVFFADLKYAKQWIQKAEECRHSTTALAYQTFLRLSVHHLATLPALPQNLALLKELITPLPIDAFSACLRYGNRTP